MTSIRESRSVRILVLEMALIAFAVVLGFAVTSWDQGRRDRDRAAEAMDRIRLELDRNASAVASAGRYYGEMSQRLDSILGARGDGVITAERIAGWRGLSPPAIRTASFDIAAATGALEHVDFALLDDIALAYEVLDAFAGTIQDAVSALVGGRLVRVGEWQVLFSLLAEIASAAEDQTARALELLPAPGQ